MRFIILFVALLVCQSCTFSKDSDFALFEKGVVEWRSDNNIENGEVFFIIPNAGCMGCIEESIRYFKEKNQLFKNNVIVIFANVQDKKLLKIQLGNDLLEERNVFISHNRIFSNDILGNTSNIIVMDENRIISIRHFELAIANDLLIAD